MTITLKTLKKATAQEVFDQVARHMLTQNMKSEDSAGNYCAYRGAHGLKCAAGCLIADDEYKTSFEGDSWEAVADGLQIKKHTDLITDLQTIHDNYEPDSWPWRLANLADITGLSDKVMRELGHNPDELLGTKLYD